MNWGTCGGTGNVMVAAMGDAWRQWDCVLGVLRYAWQYCGQYGRGNGGPAAVLGGSMVGVSEDAWRYWGVPLTP